MHPDVAGVDAVVEVAVRPLLRDAGRITGQLGVLANDGRYRRPPLESPWPDGAVTLDKFARGEMRSVLDLHRAKPIDKEAVVLLCPAASPRQLLHRFDDRCVRLGRAEHVGNHRGDIPLGAIRLV